MNPTSGARVRMLPILIKEGRRHLLVSIPSPRAAEDRKRDRRRAFVAAVMVYCVFGTYVATFVMRLKQSS